MSRLLGAFNSSWCSNLPLIQKFYTEPIHQDLHICSFKNSTPHTCSLNPHICSLKHFSIAIIIKMKLLLYQGARKMKTLLSRCTRRKSIKWVKLGETLKLMHFQVSHVFFSFVSGSLGVFDCTLSFCQTQGENLDFW